MKWKTDEQGKVVAQDGHPILVHDDGREVPFDGPAAIAKIKELSEDRDGWRTKAQDADKVVEALKDIDPAKAREALKVVANLEAGKLKDAEQVEAIKKQVAEGYERQISDLGAKHKTETETYEQRIDRLTKGNAFRGSRFVAEKLLLPADIAETQFAGDFKRGDGDQLIGLLSGKEIFSRSRPGEYADFDEALEVIIGAYPNKDRILKGVGASGGGAEEAARTGNGAAKTATRAQFSAMTPAQKTEFGKQKGEIVG